VFTRDAWNKKVYEMRSYKAFATSCSERVLSFSSELIYLLWKSFQGTPLIGLSEVLNNESTRN